MSNLPNLLLAAVHVAAIAAIAAAMIRPTWRAAVATALLTLGVLAAGTAAVGGARELELFHSFAAYDGNEIRLMPFLVDRVTAPGFAWGLVALAFCGGWALWLWAVRPGADPESRRPGAGVHHFAGPLALAWTSIACQLALQKAAAPAGLVTPLAFDRALFPASIAACFLLAIQVRRVMLVLAWLSVLVTAGRLPLALFGTFATQREFGTSLDVHSITMFVDPFTQSPVQVAQQSSEQLTWLIWLPNLLVMPALYMLSLSGIAFAVTMFVTHPHSANPGGSRPARSGDA